MLTRRGFLTSGLALAAPAIIPYARLMPVRAIDTVLWVIETIFIVSGWDQFGAPSQERIVVRSNGGLTQAYREAMEITSIHTPEYALVRREAWLTQPRRLPGRMNAIEYASQNVAPREGDAGEDQRQEAAIGQADIIAEQRQDDDVYGRGYYVANRDISETFCRRHAPTLSGRGVIVVEPVFGDGVFSALDPVRYLQNG